MPAKLAALVSTPAHLVRRFTNIRLHKFDPLKFQTPGWVTTLGFKLTDPIGAKMLEISRGLSISETQVGHLISAYAIGVVVGAFRRLGR